jgi:anti-sigma B factor antagonist
MPTDQPPPAFTVHLDAGRPNAIVLRIDGELDLATAPLAREQWAKLVAERQAGQDLAVIDLSRVSFLGSSGLAMLIAFAEDAERNGLYLRLFTAGAHSVHRPLQTVGLLDRFALIDNLDEALDGPTF